MKIALIGSTGLNISLICEKFQEKEVLVDNQVVKFDEGEAFGHTVYFFVRNLKKGSLAPHGIDYLLIMNTIKQLGVDAIFGTSVVGSLNLDYKPGDYVIVDQFLDFTKHRAFTVFTEKKFAFVDFTYPYCSSLREILKEACITTDVKYKENGCYVGVDGPRYETAAEVRAYGILGGDIIGMTNVPEVILAREMGLCYSSIALIVNYAAGISQKPILRKDCYDETIKYVDRTVEILRNAIELISKKGICDCKEKNSDMICDIIE